MKHWVEHLVLIFFSCNTVYGDISSHSHSLTIIDGCTREQAPSLFLYCNAVTWDPQLFPCSHYRDINQFSNKDRACVARSATIHPHNSSLCTLLFPFLHFCYVFFLTFPSFLIFRLREKRVKLWSIWHWGVNPQSTHCMHWSFDQFLLKQTQQMQRQHWEWPKENPH